MTFVVCCRGGVIQTFALPPVLRGQNAVLIATLPGHSGRVNGVCWLSVGGMVAPRWSQLHIIAYSWRAQRMEERDVVLGTGRGVVCADGDETELLSCGADGAVIVWQRAEVRWPFTTPAFRAYQVFIRARAATHTRTLWRGIHAGKSR